MKDFEGKYVSKEMRVVVCCSHNLSRTPIVSWWKISWVRTQTLNIYTAPKILRTWNEIESWLLQSKHKVSWDVVSSLGHLLDGQFHLTCLVGVSWSWKGLEGRAEWESTFVGYLVRPHSKQQRRKGNNSSHGDTRSARCITGTILQDINVSCFSSFSSLTSSASFPRLVGIQDTRLSHGLGLLSQAVLLHTLYPRLHWCSP